MSKQNSENIFTNDAKEEVEGMKKDLESLTHRLKNVTGNAKEILSEQMENLSHAMYDLKDQGIHYSRDALAEICNSTRRHPTRNLAYAFAAGFMAAFLFRR